MEKSISDDKIPLISNEVFEIWGAGIILDTKIFNKVKKLIKNGPAHLAGLKSNDLIIKINNVDINENINYLNLAGEYNTELNLKVLRNNREVDVSMRRTLSLLKKYFYKDTISS